MVWSFSVISHQLTTYEIHQQDGTNKNKDKMRKGWNVHADKSHADESAQESSQTPQSMKGGHNGLSVQVFCIYSLCVGGGVVQVGTHTEKKESSHQQVRIVGNTQGD